MESSADGNHVKIEIENTEVKDLFEHVDENNEKNEEKPKEFSSIQTHKMDDEETNIKIEDIDAENTQYGTGNSSTGNSVTIDIEDAQPFLYSNVLPENQGTGEMPPRDPQSGTKDSHSVFNLFLGREKFELYTEEVVNTEYGDVTVAIKGDLSNPTILTYHHLGLNNISNFKGLFNVPFSADIVKNFCIVHVNAPGQEEGARVLPEDFEYPDMDQLAEQVRDKYFS